MKKCGYLQISIINLMKMDEVKEVSIDRSRWQFVAVAIPLENRRDNRNTFLNITNDHDFVYVVLNFHRDELVFWIFPCKRKPLPR